MDPGATLRHAREQRRLTIGQIADATKISLANLQALEASDYERLPAAVYARGFVRAYAREVGLDPAEMSEQYSRAMDDALTVNGLERRAAAVEAAAALAEEQAAARSAEAQREAAERRAAAARRRAAAEARLAAAVARYRQAKRAGVAGVSSAAERITSVPSRIPAALPHGLTSLPRSEQAAAAVIVLVLVVSAIAFRDVGKAPGVATAQAVQAGLAPAAVPAPTSAQSDAVPAAQVVHDGLTIELKTSGP